MNTKIETGIDIGTSAHLNEESLTRWQMGDGTEAELTHLAECSKCRAQTVPLKDALSWFGAAARQWGEEKAAVAQEWREAKNAAAREWQESKIAAVRNWRGMVAAWAVASVALLLFFGIGVPRWKAHRAALEAQVQQRQQEQRQELARDNALLEEVDEDVSQAVPEAMQPLSWNTANGGTSSSSSDAASRQ
jgi:hypothetical protein